MEPTETRLVNEGFVAGEPVDISVFPCGSRMPRKPCIEEEGILSYRAVPDILLLRMSSVRKTIRPTSRAWPIPVKDIAPNLTYQS